MAARICQKTHDIKQTQKVIPLISRETSFCQFDLNLWFCVDSVKQPIKSDSVSSRHMSHRGTSSFDYHFDHGFVVFKDIQLRFPFGKNVCWWVRDPLHLTDQQLVFFWLSGPWFWNQELRQFPGGLYVWFEPCCQLNVTLRSPCHKDQEQVSHPCVIQHPEK